MTAQGRRRCDAQGVVDVVGAAPVEHLRPAIMTVAAQEDFRLRPMAPDRPKQTAEKGLDLLAARTSGRTKDAGDEPAFAIEDDDGLKAILIVMSVEQAQLLATMDGIERVVDVEHDPLGHLMERAAIQIHHGARHPQQGPRIRQILQPGNRRLRTQFPVGRRQIERHLEHRIAPQAGGIVAILIAGGDHQQTKADDIGQTVSDQVRRTRILDAGRQTLGHLQTLLGLAQKQQAAIGR